MKVSELIDILKRGPQDAEVRITTDHNRGDLADIVCVDLIKAHPHIYDTDDRDKESTALAKALKAQGTGDYDKESTAIVVGIEASGNADFTAAWVSGRWSGSSSVNLIHAGLDQLGEFLKED